MSDSVRPHREQPTRPGRPYIYPYIYVCVCIYIYIYIYCIIYTICFSLSPLNLYDRLWVNPHHYKWLHFIHFYGWVIVLWTDWCWSWNTSTLATSCEELTHWKRPWCWDGLGAGGEGGDRGWDGWMASPTWWAWVWAISGVGDGQESLVCWDSWGRKESDMIERLNWTELNRPYTPLLLYPFVCWGISRLPPRPSYCQQCCNEYWDTCVFLNCVLFRVYVQQWDCWYSWFFKETLNCFP